MSGQTIILTIIHFLALSLYRGNIIIVPSQYKLEKMKITIKFLVAVTLFLTVFSQRATSQVDPINYVHSADSVAGFNETAAAAEAAANAFFGVEYKYFMYKAKRAFINQKYNIKPAQAPRTLYQNPLTVGRPGQQAGGACDNEDFELGTIQGWVAKSGINSNSCQNPNLPASLHYTVYSAAQTDTRIPYPIESYFDAGIATVPAGDGFIRLNDDKAGAKAVRLTKSIDPTPTNAVFQYAYLAVIEDGSHQCCVQAGFNIKISVTHSSTNSPTLLTCPQISVAVPGAACNFTIPLGGPTFSPALNNAPGNAWSYCDWTASAIDLSQYLNGYTVTIDVTVVDCTAGGHGGYCYFDSKCSGMDIIGNNQNFPADEPNITLPTCGAQGATICATPGLGPYSWAGPNVPTNYSTPSMTNICFTASLSSTYTLTMNPPGSCQPIVKVITTTITPAPLIFASVVQAKCGSTLAVVSATPSGSASNSSTLTWSPNPFSVNQNNATFTLPAGPGLMPVYVTAKDPLGCRITTSVGVEPGAPFPTFVLLNTTNANSLTCNTPVINFSVSSTYTYGPLTYFWSSNSATFNTNPVSITIAGNYTVTIKDPNTGCTADSVFSVGQNIVPPVVALTPTSQIITCNLSSIQTVTITASSPTVNISLSVMSPLGGSLTSKSHTMQYIPSVGPYTVTATNDVNGCVTTRGFTVTSTQGFPTFTLTSAENFSLGCGTRSIANVNIVNASATDPNQQPNGGPVSYTLLSPSASSVTPSGTLSAQSNYTVNVPGTWTVVTKDNTSFCETRLSISILSNTFSPHLKAVIPRNILDCNTPSIVAVGESTTKGVSYTWNFQGNPGSQPGAAITIVSNPAAPTSSLINNYTLVIVDNSSTCRSTSVIPIYQSLFPPRAVITGSGALSCITTSIMLTNQSSSSIPPGIGFPIGQPVVGFLWKGPSPQQPQSNATTYLARVPGIYTLTAKDMNNGCTSQTTTTIDDNIDYPILNNPVAGATGILDCGVNATATISPIITSLRTNLTFTWSGPPGFQAVSGNSATIGSINSPTLIPNMLGEYLVLARDNSNGCESRARMEVVPGVLTASFSPDQTSGYAPMTVKFTNNSSTTTGTTGIISLWNFGNGAVSSSSVTSAFTATVPPGTPSVASGVNANFYPTTVFTQPGTYSVTLYVSKGECRERITKVITVDIPSELTIPNVFTPNGDGINDVYHLKTTNLTEVSMTIFDRWGHLVYELTSSTGNVLWDGKNQFGVEVAEGTYFYVIKATGKDGVNYDKNGTINVYR